MSARELILDGGDRLDGSTRKLKLNDTSSGECVCIMSPEEGVLAVLDRTQMHMLAMYLQERLSRSP